MCHNETTECSFFSNLSIRSISIFFDIEVLIIYPHVNGTMANKAKQHFKVGLHQYLLKHVYAYYI